MSATQYRPPFLSPHLAVMPAPDMPEAEADLLTVSLPVIREGAVTVPCEADLPIGTPPAAIALATELIRHICLWCCNLTATAPLSVCAPCQVHVEARDAEDAATQRWMGEHCGACGQCNFECECAPPSSTTTHSCMLCLVAPTSAADSVCAPCQVHVDADAAEQEAHQRWLNELCGLCSQTNYDCDCSERHDAETEERRAPRCRACGCDMEDGTDWWDVCSRSCNRDLYGRF